VQVDGAVPRPGLIKLAAGFDWQLPARGCRPPVSCCDRRPRAVSDGAGHDPALARAAADGVS
jgi:hypothetical protein